MVKYTDNLGTPQKMTDSSGSIVWDRTQLPFGETLSIKGATTDNLRFPGQYFDMESGLNYNMMRSYVPTLGRYTQVDPFGLSGGINIYGYVKNNPTNLTDPLGLFYTWPDFKINPYAPVTPEDSSHMTREDRENISNASKLTSDSLNLATLGFLLFPPTTEATGAVLFVRYGLPTLCLCAESIHSIINLEPVDQGFSTAADLFAEDKGLGIKWALLKAASSFMSLFVSDAY